VAPPYMSEAAPSDPMLFWTRVVDMFPGNAYLRMQKCIEGRESEEPQCAPTMLGLISFTTRQRYLPVDNAHASSTLNRKEAVQQSQGPACPSLMRCVRDVAIYALRSDRTSRI
jgi:hypothetical protein